MHGVCPLSLGDPKQRGGGRPASAAPAAGGRRRFHSLAPAPQARSFRDADWPRRLRAAVSSGLEATPPRPRPRPGEGGESVITLKGLHRLKARTAPKEQGLL